MNNKIAVVIPYHHNTLSELEKISFYNCLNVLKEYPIILVMPRKMSKERYPRYHGLLYDFVPDSWMENVAAYNRMMLTKKFYVRFKQYEYILIFQLDAFVFCDCLERFCDLGYDYIGAPWIGGCKYLKNIQQGIWYVGNGGFSLRKVSAFLDTFQFQTVHSTEINEDVFWAACNSESFHVAPLDIALQFAFEQNVRQCYLLNNSKLPFGCHAWGKYDFDFWRPIFEERGYFVTSKMPEGLDKKNNYMKPQRHYLEAGYGYLMSCLKALAGEKKSDIYIFGVGENGKECGWLMLHSGIQNVKYIDNNSRVWGNKLWDILIESPEIIKNQEKDPILIIITANGYKEEILNQLRMWKFQYGTEVFFYSDLIDCIKKGISFE